MQACLQVEGLLLLSAHFKQENVIAAHLMYLEQKNLHLCLSYNILGSSGKRLYEGVGTRLYERKRQRGKTITD